MKRETLQGKRISKESVCSGTFPLPKEVRDRLSYIDAILQAAYGTPDLGNVADPLEELVFLIITQRTKNKTAIQVFHNLKEQFSVLDGVLQASESDLGKILSVGGRGNLRVRAVRELLNTVKEKTGALSLGNLRQMNETEAFEFLLPLPWVGEKIARCVMLYSLGFNTFPADVNAIRIFRRTGVLDPVIGSLEGVEHRKAQSKIAPWIPADIARTLHVNMVVHGQEVCRERNPRCERCEIRKLCAFWRISRVKEAEKARFTMVDLFSGAGGISLGFHDEGFRIALAVDNDSRALQTIGYVRRLARWYKNHGSDISEHETRTFLIVPVLLALGWSEQKMKIEWNNLDIAFFTRAYDKKATKEDCIMILESKRMWEGLSYAERQVKNYQLKFPNCSRLIVSDGVSYRLYHRKNDLWEWEAYLNLLKLKDRHAYYVKIRGALDVFLNLMPA